MNKKKLIFIISTAFLFISYGSVLAKDKQPNILLVVVDDMGYSDIGPFGGEVR